MKEINSIWLIDDDMISLQLHNEIITAADSTKRVTRFSNAEKALEKIKTIDVESLPELILLDLVMPEMSGFKFLEELEKIKRSDLDLPMIMVVSDIVPREDQLRLSRHDFVHSFVSKPLDPQLISALFLVNKQIVKNKAS